MSSDRHRRLAHEIHELLDRTRRLVSDLRQEPGGTRLTFAVTESPAHVNLLETATTVVVFGNEADRLPQVVVVSVPQQAAASGPAPSAVLSGREAEVLVLVASALSNRQIAKQLAITEATVKRHLRNIFEKLDAVSRIDALNKATTAGLIRSEDHRYWPAGQYLWPDADAESA